MVKNPSALKPKIINMVPSTWQRVEEWKRWSLFTRQGRCAATIKLIHPTGAAPTQVMKKIWWQSSQMPIRRPFCPLPKTWKLYLPVLLETKHTITLFLDITITQLSWFFATSSIHCLSRATKRCRYGTDRIGWTAERKTTAVKLVLMCMHGMSESAHCPQLPSITLKVEEKQ